VRNSRARTALAAGGAIALVATVGVGAWLLLFRDQTKAVDIGDVVTDFRNGGEGTGALASGLEAGVYVYATSGFEVTDALLGQRHEYPARSTVTVQPGGCGAVIRWDALEGRYWERELCGRELRRFTEVHSFFGTEDVHDYVCESGTPAPPLDAEPGVTWESRCSTADTTETSRGTVVGRETSAVGGQAVETTHVSEQTTLEGASRGTGIRERWFARDSGLLVRQVEQNESVTDSPIGEVGYRERYELLLMSLEPRR
jgi:hypothetical protein